MKAIDYANQLDAIDNQIDEIMLMLTDLEQRRQRVWTQWNLEKRKEAEHEQQLRLDLAV